MSNKNARIRNDLSILAIIVSSLRLIIAEGTDRAVRPSRPQSLDENEILRLRTILKKIEAFADKVKVEINNRTVSVMVNEICDCPIHVECLRRVGVYTLSELHDADPFLVKETIDVAEKRSGKPPQYQLYSSLKFRTEQVAKSHEQPHPKGRS
jgi:hypothetical protein